MNNWFFLVPVALVILACVRVIFTARTPKRPEPFTDEAENPIPGRITVDDLGRIEKDLTSLRQVIVVADRVERPTSELSSAVEHNFERGVKYLFLVSKRHALVELNGYYKLFEALAHIVISRTGQEITLNQLIDIQQLPYDWDDYPYIFYQVEKDSTRTWTVAFRGDQEREGIADDYMRLDPSLARTIARAVLADAPSAIRESISIDRNDFVDIASVIPNRNGKSSRVTA